MPLTWFADVGLTAAGFSSFVNTGVNTLNEMGSRVITPPTTGSRVVQISCFFAGNSQTTNARLVVWRTSDGVIVAKSLQFTAPSGSLSTGGQALQTQPVDNASFQIIGNESIWIGFWRDPTKSSVWSIRSTGSYEIKTDLSGDAGSFNANTACGGSLTCGDPQAFARVVGGNPRVMQAGFVGYFRKKL